MTAGACDGLFAIIGATNSRHIHTSLYVLTIHILSLIVH